MIIDDPKAYRARCTPRDSAPANASINAFFHDVRDLMGKHQIADLTMCAQVVVEVKAQDLTETDEEVRANACAHIGARLHGVEMSAYLYAYMRSDLERMIESTKSRAQKNFRKND